jgi:hypothetical protein
MGRGAWIMSGYEDEIVRVSHMFEIELSILVTVNYQLTIEGIDKMEREEIAETRKSLELEDPDLVESQVRWQQTFFYDGMRKAATHLAIVGLVTRLQHWIERFVRLKQLQLTKKKKLVAHIEALNSALGEGPVPITFFEDLVMARDSIIHGDSKAQWPDSRTGTRRVVAKHYQNGGDLEVTENQLKDAIEKAEEQVKWYDRKL